MHDEDVANVVIFLQNDTSLLQKLAIQFVLSNLWKDESNQVSSCLY